MLPSFSGLRGGDKDDPKAVPSDDSSVVSASVGVGEKSSQPQPYNATLGKVLQGIRDEIVSLGILMGIVWEAYHEGVPLLGVPENPTDYEWKV